MEGRGELGLSSFVVSKGMGMGITEDRRGPSGKILPGLKMDLEEALCRLREVFAAKGVVLAYLFWLVCGGDGYSEIGFGHRSFS